MVRRAVLFVSLLSAAVALSCSRSPETPIGPSSGVTDLTRLSQGISAVLVGTGDIGECGSPGVAQTANLVAGIEGTVFMTGDLAYMSGSLGEFTRCFDPTWGRFRNRWRPVPGNHEYETPGAAGYFDYFGAAAGPGRRGYYSFRAGEWLVLMLDSNIPVGPGSAQYEFVRAELAANYTPCAAAMWHHPLFTSGPNGNNPYMRDMWDLLQTHNVELIVNGHDHMYERFARQDRDGRPSQSGIRQITVGTGGARPYQSVRLANNSEVRISAYGVVKFNLHPMTFEWSFIDTTGRVGDFGIDTCQ
jgi:3',5'-cyclic AMP phosphodiesterase CpdA